MKGSIHVTTQSNTDSERQDLQVHMFPRNMFSKKATEARERLSKLKVCKKTHKNEIQDLILHCAECGISLIYYNVRLFLFVF